MLADGKYTRLQGVSFELGDTHEHHGHCDGHTVSVQVGVDEVTGEPIYGTETEYRDCLLYTSRSRKDYNKYFKLSR